MKPFNASDFLVSKPIRLKDIPTVLESGESEKGTKKALKKVGKKLADMQDTMYAHNRYGVLVCLQGMDTSGKDSLIREVFSKLNPRGVVVHSFKTPSSNELQHDYLWRHAAALPERGKYSIFNRSHYENVLVTRVNPDFLLNEHLPDIDSVEDVTESFWETRFQQIRNFEEHIAQNGVIVFKFFLHLSKEEQRTRLLRRLNKKDKIWKFAPSDITERALWDKYQTCYEDAINQTSLPHAPWYVIPADDKAFARYLVAKIIHDVMATYTDITEPEPDQDILKQLDHYKKLLTKKDG